LSASGGVQSGEVDAADRPEALRVLDRRGLQPVSLKESANSTLAPAQKKAKNEPAAPKTASKTTPTSAAKGKAAKEGEEKVPDGPLKIKRAEVIMFTEELSDMLGAGLQLEPALQSMENRQELGGLKDVASRIRQLVRDGMNFSTAIKRSIARWPPRVRLPARWIPSSSARPTTSRRSPTCRPA
jgi:general secretion pathway protein F/type IV pilus assembly protein PilC